MRSKSVEIKGVRSSAAHQRALYTQNLIDKSLVKIRFFLLYSYISVKINTLLMAISEAIAFIVFIAHLHLGQISKLEILTEVSVVFVIQKVYCCPLLSHDQLLQRAIMFIEQLDLETLSTVPR